MLEGNEDRSNDKFLTWASHLFPNSIHMQFVILESHAHYYSLGACALQSSNVKALYQL